MNRWIKGLGFLLASTFFAALGLVVSVTDASQFTVPIAIAYALFISLFLDLSFSLIHKARTERADWGTEARPAEKVFLGFSIVRNTAGMLLFVAFAGLFLYVVTVDAATPHFGAEFFVQFGVYAVYFLLLRRFTRKLSDAFAATAPRYSLKENGLTLDLNMTDLRDSKRKFTVAISFDEIDKLEVMTYLEAQEYLAYQTGITLTTKMKSSLKSISEEIAYVKGDIPKPKNYLRVLGMNFPVLVMIGPDLIYAVSVSNSENENLVKAFQDYKKNRPM